MRARLDAARQRLEVRAKARAEAERADWQAKVRARARSAPDGPRASIPRRRMRCRALMRGAILPTPTAA